TAFRPSSSGSKRPGANYFCTHCQIPGHSYDRCFKVHGFPPGFRGFKDKKFLTVIQNDESLSSQPGFALACITPEQYQHLLGLLSKHQPTAVPEEKDDQDVSADASVQSLLAGKFCLFPSNGVQWILESGATDHMCSNVEMFIRYLPNPDLHQTIIILDGRRGSVSHIGTVCLSDQITLFNVLHVSSFQFNLISVSKLCKDLGCRLIFDKSCCYIQDQTQKGPVTLLGNLHCGLYHFDQSLLLGSSSSNKFCSAVVNDAHLWHLRLGHIPYAQLKLLILGCNINKSCQHHL
ncbi:Retrovirus-related Pol polyprotein from transposon RE1, partial [Bienertia sinuspersici]